MLIFYFRFKSFAALAVAVFTATVADIINILHVCPMNIHRINIQFNTPQCIYMFDDDQVLYGKRRCSSQNRDCMYRWNTRFFTFSSNNHIAPEFHRLDPPAARFFFFLLYDEYILRLQRMPIAIFILFSFSKL